MKQCTKCGEMKPLSEYFIKDKKTGRRMAHCKACHEQYRTTWKRPIAICKQCQQPYARESPRQQFCTHSCSREYLRGQPRGDMPSTLKDYFIERIDKTETCWLWTGPRQETDGYGRFTYAGERGYAHRLAYELFIGPIPESLVIDHLCRTPLCCNPEHLEPVTDKVNVARGESPPARAMRYMQCKRGHPYTPENTMTKTDKRGTVAHECRTCRKMRTQARRAALKDKHP